MHPFTPFRRFARVWDHLFDRAPARRPGLRARLGAERMEAREVPAVFMSEVGYDPAGPPQEAIAEVAGTDPAGWSLRLDDGGGRVALAVAPDGQILDERDGLGAVATAPADLDLPPGLTGPARPPQLPGTGGGNEDFAWGGPAVESPGRLDDGQAAGPGQDRVAQDPTGPAAVETADRLADDHGTEERTDDESRDRGPGAGGGNAPGEVFDTDGTVDPAQDLSGR
ncbi:MAG: hypothetical protein C0501_27065 [Isosphaera sp.]|nr:hypothetical protein [Isosphaera sp.]